MLAGAAAGTENSTATSARFNASGVTLSASPPLGSIRATTSNPRSGARSSMVRPILPNPITASRATSGIPCFEEFGVQALHQRIHLVPIHDHCKVDARGAERKHVQPGVADGLQRPRHRRPAFAEGGAHQGHDATVALDGYVTQLTQLA